MTSPLHNQRIWLIGASFGIGEALAQALSACGAKLVLSARSTEKLEALAANLTECHAIPCDVTSHDTIIQAHADAIKAYDGLDMVIYNAGTYDPTSSAEFDLARVERMIDVNLHGAIRALHTALPAMKAQQSGKIVLVGSVAGYRGLPKAMGYGLSKAALIHLADPCRWQSPLIRQQTLLLKG